MSSHCAPGRRVSPRGLAPLRSPGRAAEREARRSGAGSGPGGPSAARPRPRLRLARPAGGGVEGGEGAAVGGSDPRAEAPTRKLRSQVESF